LKLTSNPKRNAEQPSNENKTESRKSSRKNWSSVVGELKRQFYKPAVEVQKFTSHSFLKNDDPFTVVSQFSN
jgi:hypothetical protein